MTKTKSASVPKRITVPLQIIDLHEDGFHPLVKIKVFGKKFIVVLDTGASKTAFDQTMLLQASENAVLTTSERLSTGLGTNSMESSTAAITDMRIGKLLIDEFEVAVLDLSTINIAYRQLGHPEVLGVLGGDLLMKYKAVIDYGKSRMLLRK
ncbi:aspartyl protease family protein [Mucilaginibacter sp. BJC16-A38]|uniref:aspartyl protease family protein n=1 Tax=Mucilaginibacter phenanthrenivorans TaxID=1234842 RepID=UPI002157D295|nr:aspartyl protease family protein [Mucilaginibacter phenanthrenivorans]MCR8559756.1 aspartyl protease family protein [Mucilaginibacter phenanthrenivorans]